MKNTIFFLMVNLILVSCKSQTFNDCDLIFQTSKSNQSSMLQICTNSKFTHVGIIKIINKKVYVVEAVQPVKITPINEWIKRGEGEKYWIKKPITTLTEIQKKQIFDYLDLQIGKNYDKKFQWSDNKIYCSELVWKAYNQAGIKLCEPKKFKDFSLESKVVKKEIVKRYGNTINLNEKVVAPSDLYDSKLLY